MCSCKWSSACRQMGEGRKLLLGGAEAPEGKAWTHLQPVSRHRHRLNAPLARGFVRRHLGRCVGIGVATTTSATTATAVTTTSAAAAVTATVAAVVAARVRALRRRRRGNLDQVRVGAASQQRGNHAEVVAGARARRRLPRVEAGRESEPRRRVVLHDTHTHTHTRAKHGYVTRWAGLTGGCRSSKARPRLRGERRHLHAPLAHLWDVVRRDHLELEAVHHLRRRGARRRGGWRGGRRRRARARTGRDAAD